MCAFFVNGEVLLAARTAVTVLVVDLDLFFKSTSAGHRSGKRRVASFVTFPSDALGGHLSFYSCLGSLVCNVAPVRRREDAEGNGNFGVKVQID